MKKFIIIALLITMIVVPISAFAQDGSAVDDAATTDQNTPVRIDVTANDGEVAEGILVLTEVSDPANGLAEINNNDTPDDPTDDFVIYTPDTDFTGTDGFTYTICVPIVNLCSSATVTVTVNAVDAGTTDGETADGGTADGGTTDGGTTDGGTTDGGTSEGGEPEPQPEPQQEGVIETTVEGKSVSQSGNTYTVTISETAINTFFLGVVPKQVTAIYLDLQQGQIVITATVNTTKKGPANFSLTITPQWTGSNLIWKIISASSSTGKLPSEVNKAVQNQFTTYLISAGLADLKSLPQGVKFTGFSLVNDGFVLTFTL
jgi:hypothetical protein